MTATMARGTRPETAPAADVPFPVWKAEAVQALAPVNERLAVATRNRLWMALYVRGFSPVDAATHAACSYAGRHPPDWAIKARPISRAARRIGSR